MRRLSGTLAAMVVSLLGAGVFGVLLTEPISFHTGAAVDATGDHQDDGTASEPPASVDFLGGQAFAGLDGVEPSTGSGLVSTPASTTPADPAPTRETTTSAPSPTSRPTPAPTTVVTTSIPAPAARSIAPSTAPPTTVAEMPLDQRVLAAIDYPVLRRLPGWRIEFLSGRAGYRGSTYPGEHLIQIYVRDGDTLDDLVHVTAHEVGHAIDVTYLSPSQRAQFNVARGVSADYRWWVQSGGDDFASGSGDWAECFAAVFAGPAGFQSRVGALPDEGQAALVRALAWS